MKNLGLFFIPVIALALVAGCSDDSDTDSPVNNSTTGTLVVRLTDAPVAYESVDVTFTELSVNHDEGWISIMLDTAMTVNLLEWNNGQSIVLGENELNPGNVKELRLLIDRASVTVDGTTHPMTIPSGTSSGLKIKCDIDIVVGQTSTLILDFDAQQSVKTTGNPSNPKGYKLSPVIRTIDLVDAGSISGIVSNPDAYAVATAKDSTGTVAGSTVADPSSGMFSIGFLPAGAYSVTIEDTLSRSYSETAVVVKAGKDNNIGTITLQ